jgi:hypothetical protein
MMIDVFLRADNEASMLSKLPALLKFEDIEDGEKIRTAGNWGSLVVLNTLPDPVLYSIEGFHINVRIDEAYLSVEDFDASIVIHPVNPRNIFA